MGSIHQDIKIEAPADQVWQAIRNFHDLAWAPNVITLVETFGDKSGDEVGAVRVLNGVFRETLLNLDDDHRILAYSIDEGPSPMSKEEVKNFVGQVTVRRTEEGDGSLVEWSSSWQENDGPVSEFCRPMYVALLKDMKHSLE